MLHEAFAEAREWLARAHRDLGAAARSLPGPEPLPDVTAYHAQQAAEKALKAYLAAAEIIFPKTHDLVRLLRLCRNQNPSFDQFVGVAEILTPYATQFRYPGGPIEPEIQLAEEALELARTIVEFVEERLRVDRGFP